MSDKLEIVMMGNRGVGKTSVLSAMWHQLDSVNADMGGVQMCPEGHTFDEMMEKWQDMLDKLVKKAPFLNLIDILDAPGSAGFTEYDFTFRAGKNEEHITFVDSAGAFTEKRQPELVDRVNEAFAVFFVVDASILMECGEDKNYKYNNSEIPKKIIDQITSDDDKKQPTFFLFILTKCEKYMASFELGERLYQRFDAVFGHTAKFINGKGIKTYYIPIQTIGKGIVFSHLDENGMPVFKTTMHKKCEPVDAAYPLVILFKHLIDKMADIKFYQIWKIICRWLKISEDVKKYKQMLDSHFSKPVFFKEL